MMAQQNQLKLSSVMQVVTRLMAFLSMAVVCSLCFAQENAIESITASQQGANVVIKVGLRNALPKAPVSFSITNPARIALDFAGAANATGKGFQEIGLGDVRSVNLVQAGDRSRLVFNLTRPLNYATVLDGNTVVVTIDGTGGIPVPVNTAGLPVPAAGASAEPQAIRDIDFRRGSNGEGRVVIDLPNNQVGVDVRQEGKKIVVDFAKTTLPDVLRRRLDVADFGTPVSTVTTQQIGQNVRMTIEPQGLWEHSAYQSDSQLVVEVKPLKEDSNKLGQGVKNYRGEKLSLNFQNVEVRAVLQVIADFTGLNIITSDTVSGNLTLRLKDVPWDQALDIVMQAKGLDMRKNGSVIWIAPRDELLTKEKLELEQRSQIAELEPVRTEAFQLNYQKAEAFKKIFGIDDSGGTSRSILTKRGSAVVDPRTNQLFITDIASKLDEIRDLIQKTDIPTRQVMIEARIVEANDSFSSSLGAKLSFGVQQNRFNLGGNQAATAATTGLAPPTLGGNSSPDVAGHRIRIGQQRLTDCNGIAALAEIDVQHNRGRGNLRSGHGIRYRFGCVAGMRWNRAFLHGVQLRENGLHQQLYVRTAGVDDDVGYFLVQWFARAREFFQRLAGIAALQQGPVLVVAGALQNAADARAQVDHRTARLEIGATLGIENRAAAGRKDDVVLRRQVADDLSFALAKTLFPLDFKDQGNGRAGTRFDFMIGINETLVQPLCQRAADRCFAGAHQADQKNIATHVMPTLSRIQPPTRRCHRQHPT